MGSQRKKYEIKKVLQTYPINKEIYIEGNEKINLPEEKKYNPEKNEDIQKIKIKFLSPLKIKKSGKLIEKLDFPILIENLLRRLYFLLKFWCDTKLITILRT